MTKDFVGAGLSAATDKSATDARELDLRDRELKIRELELKQKRHLETLKIITTGVVVTLIPAIINHQIQNQEIEINRLEGEIEYLEKFSDDVVEQDDLVKRRNFVEYLATIAHSDQSRARWKEYLGKVDKLAEKQEAVDIEIAKKEVVAREIAKRVADLEVKVENARNEQLESDQLKVLKETLNEKSNQLEQIEREILGKEYERQILIERYRLKDKEKEPTSSEKIIERFYGPDRRAYSNELADLYQRQPSQVVNSLLSSILPQSDLRSYRVNLYIVRTLGTIKTGWVGTDEQLGEIEKLRETINYRDPTFKKRVEEAIHNHRDRIGEPLNN